MSEAILVIKPFSDQANMCEFVFTDPSNPDKTSRRVYAVVATSRTTGETWETPCRDWAFFKRQQQYTRHLTVNMLREKWSYLGMDEKDFVVGRIMDLFPTAKIMKHKTLLAPEYQTLGLSDTDFVRCKMLMG